MKSNHCNAFNLIIDIIVLNGICCESGEGSYLLAQGTAVLASGDDFSASKITDFCVTESASETAISQVSELKAKENVNENVKLEVYPNPTTRYVVIKAENSGQYLIRDMAGKDLLEGKVLDN